MREYTTSFILSSLLIHSSLTCLWCSSLHVMATLSLSHTSSALPSVNASALLGQKLRANPARVNLPRAPSRSTCLCVSLHRYRCHVCSFLWSCK
eukprot:c20461_g1_i1 orf=127-408(+)